MRKLALPRLFRVNYKLLILSLETLFRKTTGVPHPELLAEINNALKTVFNYLRNSVVFGR